jgi:magnesium transporter
MNISTPTGRMAEVPLGRLAGEPAAIAHILAAYQAVEIAEALNRLDRPDAARILAAMPRFAAIQVFNLRDLVGAAELLELMPLDCAPAILSGLHSDRRVGIFRQLGEVGRDRLKARLPEATREALDQLLQYPPQSAGGLMTTDFVAVPADWTVARTLQHIHDVGRNRETVYTVCVLEPASNRLLKVIGLWRLVVSEPETKVLEAARAHAPIVVAPLTDREEVARLISKYNLLAVPVVTESGQVLGIVTVDDVIDAIIAEGTEDVQKFGGSQALDEAYLNIGFANDPQTRRLAVRAIPLRNAHRQCRWLP